MWAGASFSIAGRCRRAQPNRRGETNACAFVRLCGARYLTYYVNVIPQYLEQPNKLRRSDVFCLRTLLALSDLHGHLLAFVQTSTSFTSDSAVVNEYVFTTFLLDEPKPFFIAEPLNGSVYST